METIREITLNQNNREEQLPNFTASFPYIATRAELEHYAVPVVPWHWHRTVELFYVESGCLVYTTPRGTWQLPAGSGGFLNANVLHTSRPVACGGGTVQLLHLFDPVILAERGSRMETRYILPLTTSDVELLPLIPDDSQGAEILAQMQQAFALSPEEWGYELLLREQLVHIWMKLLTLAQPSMGRKPCGEDDAVKTMMIYVHEHFRETISVAQLAESAHVSKRVCFRLFRDRLHMTPLEYLRSYRLQEACRRLTTSGEAVTRIACDCGLGSCSYFGKLFREQFGCSPTAYREKWHDRDSFCPV